MKQIIAIMRKDLTQWTRRPLYFFASITLAVLILLLVGNTFSGAQDIPLGLYDPDQATDLSKQFAGSRRFAVKQYADLRLAKEDLAHGQIAVLASVSQNALDDEVTLWTEGHNLLTQQQTYAGLFEVLSKPQTNGFDLPVHASSLYPMHIKLRDYITPGLMAYLCYVLACMNIGFAWIYEWMEKTYKQIALAPNGLRSAVIAKTLTVMMEASVVLWLALCITSPLGGFSLGNNFVGLVLTTLLSVFCFTCVGLGLACFLRTIRIYTMVISICGVAWLFCSGIIVPLETMPQWEQIAAHVLPLYYSADAFKGVVLGTPASYTRDALVLCAWAFAGLAVSSIFLSRRQAVI
jgi:ABC-type multidrug transport system permease subunit